MPWPLLLQVISLTLVLHLQILFMQLIVIYSTLTPLYPTHHPHLPIPSHHHLHPYHPLPSTNLNLQQKPNQTTLPFEPIK